MQSLRRAFPRAGLGRAAVARADLRPIAWLRLVELALLTLLMVQVARLVWAVATPVGAFGTWTGRHAVIPPTSARMALFASFDPFFRTAPAGEQAQVVTSLALTVYGIRLNEGSGLGSAIVATPDGVQNSYAVGDEIMPGVRLKAVAFDNIVIDRGGTEETVFLDQSQAAPAAASAAPPIAGGGVPADARAGAGPGVGVAALRSEIGFSPRMQGGRITGIVLTPQGPAYEAAGFRPGDIVTQVNGRPITSVADVAALQSQIAPGARLSLMVERGNAVVPIALTLQAQ